MNLTCHPDSQLWCFLTLALHLTNADDETAAPSPAAEQNPAMSPPEFPEIMPPPNDTPPPDAFPTEITPPSDITQETMPPGMEQTYSPENPDMSGQPRPDTGQEPWDNRPSPVDGMAYTTSSPLNTLYTRGVTRKTRWGSNRNTVKRYNNLNPVGTGSQRERGRNKGQMDRQEGPGDGILPSLKYKEKWNRVGVIKGGD